MYARVWGLGSQVHREVLRSIEYGLVYIGYGL